MELYFLVARIMRRYKEVIFDNNIDLALIEILILGGINMNYNTASKLVKVTLQEMSYISKIISGLIEKKMVKKQQSDLDKRVCVLGLTERGMEVLIEINEIKETMLMENLEIINLKERKELLFLLNKLEFILSSSREKIENPLFNMERIKIDENILGYNYNFEM